MTALAGDNGAGKSVTIKTISGLWPPDEGELLWQGQPVQLHGPKDAEALGITTIYQDLALCDNLDIVQNMFLGHEPLRRGILDEDSMEIAARKTLEELRVRTIRSIRQPVASLSGGQRQSVAVAKAVLFEREAGDHGRADRGAGRLADPPGPRPDQAAGQPGSRRDGRSPTTSTTCSRWPTASRSCTSGAWWPVDEASKFDRQVVVDYMTTGQSARELQPAGVGAGPNPAGI